MAEGINLTEPFNTKPSATTVRFGSLLMQMYALDPNDNVVEAPFVRVTVVGENGQSRTREWRGDEARTIMGQVNRGDFRSTSLRARVLTRLQQDDPAMAGAIADLPDNPVAARYEGMAFGELVEEAQRRNITVEGTGARGRVRKDDLVNALATAESNGA